jgi:hypothetical protein
MKKIATSVLALALLAGAATADTVYQGLPFTQNWTNIGMITVDDNWSGVPGITGFRGDNLTALTNADPQTLTLADDATPVIDVNANRSDPSVFTSGGLCEFDGITDPTVAFQGSGTADAPYLQIYINAAGYQNISVMYSLRDIDGLAGDNAIQQVALQFRVGTSGTWTNVPAAYVADATTGGNPNPTVLVTPVAVILPAAADNASQLQIRIMTANAPGNDEFVGVDNIVIEGTPVGTPTQASTWGRIKSIYR